MSISQIIHALSGINAANEHSYINDKKHTVSRQNRNDTVMISSEAYRLKDTDKLTASSGKDSLGITRGGKYNSFIIHFSDSAMVSRAVKRGYITVNGVRLELTDEVKEALTETDRAAQADREAAFDRYIMQHDAAVSKQQADTIKCAVKEMQELFEIAAKISSGADVSPEEKQKLMEKNPKLYFMAQAAAMTAEKQENRACKSVGAPRPTDDSDDRADGCEGVSWSQFEWRHYETQMTVSLNEDGAKTESVCEGELLLN